MLKAAIYARYSTDMQREASIDDQLRNCKEYAAKHNIAIAYTFFDKGMSGTTNTRPDYVKMNEAAQAGLFNVLIVDDLSRLTRKQSELARLKDAMQYLGISIISVSDNIDTSNKNHKLHMAFKGIINETYIDDLKEKVKRGMTGKALNGMACGGRAFGYRSIPVEDPHNKDQYGRPRILHSLLAINEQEAVWVKKIFQWYVDGHSCKWIASELNRLGVKAHKGKGFSASTIYGEHTKGTGILNNTLYIGQYIWRKTTYIKHPETGARRRIPLPKEDWIVKDMPNLAIISKSLWDACKEKQSERQNKTILIRNEGKKGAYRQNPKYLFTGILKCDECGSGFTIVANQRYGCSSSHYRGKYICSNSSTVSRHIVEQRLLAGIKEKLLSKEYYERFHATLRELVANHKSEDALTPIKQELKETEKQLDNLLNAIKMGIITDTTKDEMHRLDALKKDLVIKLEAYESSQSNIAQMIPNALKNFETMVNNLEKTLESDIPKARRIIKGIIGDDIIMCNVDGHIEAKITANTANMMVSKNSSVVVVPDVRHGNQLTFRINLAANPSDSTPHSNSFFNRTVLRG